MPTSQPIPWRLSRRELVQLSLVVPLLPRSPQERRVQNTADGEPQFVTPPGEPDAKQAQRIEEIGVALAAGKATANEVLADPGSNDLRPFAAFRARIEKHAPLGRAVLTPKGEPGVELLATVRVVDKAGKPTAGARVYAYQTSAKGWYAAEAPHVSGNGGDTRFARLFTHGVTDADGRCELVTIHPAGYPRTDLPSHIHLQLLNGADERWTEIRFEDCPRMTPAVHAESLRSGYVVAPVETLAGGALRCTAEFELPAHG